MQVQLQCSIVQRLNLQRSLLSISMLATSQLVIDIISTKAILPQSCFSLLSQQVLVILMLGQQAQFYQVRFQVVSRFIVLIESSLMLQARTQNQGVAGEIAFLRELVYLVSTIRVSLVEALDVKILTSLLPNFQATIISQRLVATQIF